MPIKHKRKLVRSGGGGQPAGGESKLFFCGVKLQPNSRTKKIETAGYSGGYAFSLGTPSFPASRGRRRCALSAVLPNPTVRGNLEAATRKTWHRVGSAKTIIHRQDRGDWNQDETATRTATRDSGQAVHTLLLNVVPGVNGTNTNETAGRKEGRRQDNDIRSDQSQNRTPVLWQCYRFHTTDTLASIRE